MEQRALNRARWQELIEEHAKSGLTQAEFCKQHNLILCQFVYYRGVAKGKTKTSAENKTLVAIQISQAIQYSLKYWIELTNYLKDSRIEIDNNLIENAIRPFTLGRKNWLFHGSPSGAKAGAILYSIIETCKVNNIELYKYFYHAAQNPFL